MIAGAGAVIVYGGAGLVAIFAPCRLMRVSEMAMLADVFGRMTSRVAFLSRFKRYKGKHFR